MNAKQIVIALLVIAGAVGTTWILVDRYERKQEERKRREVCRAAGDAYGEALARISEARYESAVPAAREYLRLRKAAGLDSCTRGASWNFDAGFPWYYGAGPAQLTVLNGKAALADVDQLFEFMGADGQRFDWAIVRDALEVALKEGIPTVVVFDKGPRDPPVEPEDWKPVEAEILLAAHAALAPKGLVWGDLLTEWADRNVAPLRIVVSIRWKFYGLSMQGGASVAESMTLRISRPGHRTATIEVDGDLPMSMTFRKDQRGRQWSSAQTIALAAGYKLKERSLRDFL